MTTGVPEVTAVGVDAEDTIYAVDVNGNLTTYNLQGSMKQLSSGLTSPTAIAIDPSGTAYILGPSSAPMTLVHPDGSKASIPVNGLYDPASFALDGYGNLLFGDSGRPTTYLPRPHPAELRLRGCQRGAGSEKLDGSISNIGNQPFDISSALPGNANFVQTSADNACVTSTVTLTGTTIAPAGDCDLGYTFTPPSAGPFTLSGTLSTTPQTLVGSSGRRFDQPKRHRGGIGIRTHSGTYSILDQLCQPYCRYDQCRSDRYIAKHRHRCADHQQLWLLRH